MFRIYPITSNLISESVPLFQLFINTMDYLSERQLHVSISIEVVASYSLSDLSDMCWWRWTNRLLLLWGRHLLFMCVLVCMLKRKRHERDKLCIGQKMVQVYLRKICQLQAHLYIWHGEYSNPPAVFSFIPVVVYLPDDVHCIALLKWQLPATNPCCQSANKCERDMNRPLQSAHFI